MKIYLDTSSIRKNSNNLDKIKVADVYVSSLVVFELISGISEKDFLLRKNIIKNLLNSSIQIDWETYKKKMYNAFNQQYDDIEGKIIKSMADNIIQCDTLQEYKNNKIYIDDNTYYTHESFKDLDNEISNTGKMFSKIGKYEWSNLNKNNRKELKQKLIDEDFIFPYIRLLSEMSISILAEDISGYKRPSDEYMAMIYNYNWSLEVYLKFMHLRFLELELNGSECSVNDMVDMLQLVYLNEDDVFITEDKIFKELNGKIQLIKIYDFGNYFLSE